MRMVGYLELEGPGLSTGLTSPNKSDCHTPVKTPLKVKGKGSAQHNVGNVGAFIIRIRFRGMYSGSRATRLHYFLSTARSLRAVLESC